MLTLNVVHQTSYSRGELLLRSFFGWLYMGIPHGFLLIFFGLWSAILGFISWWIILFTGAYPQNFFEYQVKLMRWSLRLNARMYNLCDGYPSFGIDGTDEATQLEVPFLPTQSRGLLLVRTFFGVIYILLPHGICLFFRSIWGGILSFIAWWVVLFTGQYPASWHEFQVGTLRWSNRLNISMSNMSDEYPQFNGRP